jgi:hypothetical protein
MSQARTPKAVAAMAAKPIRRRCSTIISGCASRVMVSASSASSGRNGSFGVVALFFGESEQALVETRVFALHLVGGAPAIHP